MAAMLVAWSTYGRSRAGMDVARNQSGPGWPICTSLKMLMSAMRTITDGDAL
jgi:hypothetical protein